MFRTFTDQMGRRHRVRMSDDEILYEVRYWCCFILICIGFAAAVTIASGILN